MTNPSRRACRGWTAADAGFVAQVVVFVAVDESAAALAATDVRRNHRSLHTPPVGREVSAALDMYWAQWTAVGDTDGGCH